ncbi:MAG: hypothetical protein PHC41_07065 [Lachnospiraceae bacterium]|nr:hypothetical protein [Lachnospiraceae bacterium]MDD3615973.1 hypothetical protein [Lachnospiraceae bacterium]
MKKTKKIIAISLSLVMIFSTNILVRASTPLKNTLTNEDLISTQQQLQDGIYKFSYDEMDGTNIVKTDITYYFVDVEKINEMNNYIKQRTSYNYKSKLDSTMSYEHYTRVYYSESGGSAKVTKVEGGYIRRDQTVSVVSQKVIIGQGNLGTSNSTTKNPTSSSWSYSTSSWPYINVSAGAVMGARYLITLKRNAGAWTSEVDNYVYNNVASPW